MGGDDLAAEGVASQPRAEPLADRCREVALELGRQVGIVRQVRSEQLLIQRHLRVREEDRDLGWSQPFSGGLTLGQRIVVGQEFECPVEPSVLLEVPDVARMNVRHRGGLCNGGADCLRLLVVVPQHEIRDLVRHLGE